MTIQHIGARAMSLYISKHELSERNLVPDNIDHDEALRLLRFALTEKHLDGWEAAELEVYPGRDSVLLFARRRSGLPRHYFFSDFEALVTAAHLCLDVLPSCLSRVSKGYILTVYPFEGEQPPAALLEFGVSLGNSTYLAAHLSEQEKVLLPTSALACIQEHFLPLIAC